MDSRTQNKLKGSDWRSGGPALRPRPFPLADAAQGNLRRLTQMLQRRASGHEVEKIMGGEPAAATGSPGITGEPYPFAAAAKGNIHELAQLLRDDVHQSLKSPAEQGIAATAARVAPGGPGIARIQDSTRAQVTLAETQKVRPEEPIVLPSIDELLGSGIQKSGPRLHIDEVPCAVTPSVEKSCRVKAPDRDTVSDYVNSDKVSPELKDAMKHLYENSSYGPELLEFVRQNDVRIVTDINAPNPARFYWEPMGVDENGKPKPGDKKIVINPNLLKEKYQVKMTDQDKLAFIVAHEIAQEKYGKDDPRNCSRFGTSEAWVEDVFEPRYLQDFPQVTDFAKATRDPRTFQELFTDFKNSEMKQEQKSAIMSRVFTEGLQHMWDMSQYPTLPEPKCGKQKGKK